MKTFKCSWLQIICFGVYLLAILVFMEYGRLLHFDKIILISAFSLNAGAEQSLPQEIIGLKKLVSHNGVQSFSMSTVLANDTRLSQRAIEYVYPARNIQGSKMLFALEAEGEQAGCRKIDVASKVVLHEC